ncbi:MAG: hypothetical protein JSV84_05385 [Gemmatimonadota bacterium]|nr:MAG: hypothetical protein JSV84_05385 [Gemmatimonadota bacterium]
MTRNCPQEPSCSVLIPLYPHIIRSLSFTNSNDAVEIPAGIVSIREVRVFFVYAGLFFISAATLIFEITLTRVLAIAQWHHLAFMVISIAMLGFGASGTVLSLFPSLLKRDSGTFLSVTGIIFSLSSVGSFALVNAISFDQFLILWEPRQSLCLAMYYLCLTIPFTASGLAVGFLLAKKAKDVSRIYFFTMVGSGAGCILAVCFAPLGAPLVIVCASLIGTVAAVLFSLRSCKMLSVATPILLLLSVLVFIRLPLTITMTPYKDLQVQLRFPQTNVVATLWNAFSRIDVIEGPAVRYAPGLSYRFQDTLPRQLGITWDGDGLTPLTEYEGDPDRLKFTDFLTSSLAYHLQDRPKVLVLGVGGGLDVLSAVYHRAESVTGVEINPLLIEILTEKYRHRTGDIFQTSNVELIVDEGRTFLRRSPEHYDVIQISLLDSQTSAAVGAYGLSENYLYTVEAFREYLKRLTRDGILSITRWLLLPPRDCLRLCTIGLTALEETGVQRPEQHIALIRSWGTSTFLLKRSPLSSDEIVCLKQFCRERGFDLIAYPGIGEEEVNLYNQLPEPYYYQYVSNLVNPSKRSSFLSDYLLDIRPTRDDRPFFHHFLKWRNLKKLYHTVGERMESFILWGDVTLMAVLGQAIFFSLVFIVLPLWIVRTRGRFGLQKRIPAAMLVYFLCLGFGFMFVVIVLIQKFILFLGRPVYALSVILFSVLVFSGCGSLASSKLGFRAKIFVPFLSIVIIAYLIVLSPLFHVCLGQSLTLRIVISVILLAPLCFIMGFPFPLGIRTLNSICPASIPWAWGMNSCSSVVGSIVAGAVALYFGFSVVFILAGMIYFIGGGILLRTKVP